MFDKMPKREEVITAEKKITWVEVEMNQITKMHLTWSKRTSTQFRRAFRALLKYIRYMLLI